MGGTVYGPVSVLWDLPDDESLLFHSYLDDQIGVLCPFAVRREEVGWQVEIGKGASSVIESEGSTVVRVANPLQSTPQIALLISHYAAVRRQERDVHTLHAVGVVRNNRMTVFFGGHRVGKTTLGLLLERVHGWKMVATNQLLLEWSGDQLTCVGCTRSITVRSGIGKVVDGIDLPEKAMETPLRLLRLRRECLPMASHLLVGSMFALSVWPGSVVAETVSIGELFSTLSEMHRISVGFANDIATFPRDTERATIKRWNFAVTVAARLGVQVLSGLPHEIAEYVDRRRQ